MSEQAFRETSCSCMECGAASRLREIIKEKDREIVRLNDDLGNTLLLLAAELSKNLLTPKAKKGQSTKKANP